VRRSAPLAAVAVLIAATMLAATYANPVIATAPPIVVTREASANPSDTQVSATPIPTASAGPHADVVPPWVTYLVSGLCLALVVALVGGMAWAALRDRIGRATRRSVGLSGEVPALADARAGVTGAVDAGLAELDDADQDPRRAIIACWLGLERAAAAAGVRRGATDTSTDLADRLLSQRLIERADVLGDFAALYREARYAPHAVDASMRERARAALVQLRRELSRPPVGRRS
jgi:hypothetical protein